MADALVTIVLKLNDKDNFTHWGTNHFCGAGHTTWYGFTCTIVDEALKYESLKLRTITPITTEQYPTPAQRPAWSVLNTEKITSIFGIDPLSWAKSGYTSMYGKIISEWRIENGELVLDVTVPPNTSAEVYVPVEDVSLITVNGSRYDKAPHVNYLQTATGASVFSVDPGAFRFAVKYAK